MEYNINPHQVNGNSGNYTYVRPNLFNFLSQKRKLQRKYNIVNVQYNSKCVEQIYSRNDLS